MMGGWEIYYTGLVVMGASVVRGYTGFGFAMIMALALGFIFDQAMITPVVLILDIAASLWLFIKVVQDVDWQSLKWIIFGAIPTLGLGSLALTLVPARPMSIVISLLILGLCFILSKNKSPVTGQSRKTALGAGLVSGFLSGMAALGGPPVVLYYFSSDRPVKQSRASMITFFFLVDIMALASCAMNGLVTPQIVKLGLGMLIPSFIGIWAGNYLFEKFANEKAFKAHVIRLLVITSLASLGKFTFFP
ncbi:MAG: sulfite exporter TauE/SafE family protein [Desulfobacterales bacterium]|nr:sulfite exporter TauE/SafE family protein [Desulfobacterales bacterium]